MHQQKKMLWGGSHKNDSVMTFFSVKIGSVWEIMLASCSQIVCMLLLLISNTDWFELMSYMCCFQAQGGTHPCSPFMHERIHRATWFWCLVLWDVIMCVRIKELCKCVNSQTVIMLMSTKLIQTHNQLMVLNVITNRNRSHSNEPQNRKSGTYLITSANILFYLKNESKTWFYDPWDVLFLYLQKAAEKSISFKWNSFIVIKCKMLLIFNFLKSVWPSVPKGASVQ